MMRPRSETLILALVAALPFLPMLVRGDVPVFRDHGDYFFPLREFTASVLRSFQLPLWNPFNASGEPWLANPQTGVFYPPSWLFLILPIAIAYVVFLAVHLFILGSGTYALFRRWTAREAAMIGAVAFMLCGPVLSLLDVSNNLASLAWIPWVAVAALERDGATFSRDALSLSLCFLGGEPFIAALGAMLYVLIRFAREGARAVGSVAAAALLTIFVAGAQLLPFVELLRGSDRAAGLESSTALKESLAPADWLALPVTPASLDGLVTRVSRSQSFLPSLYFAPFVFFAAVAAPLLFVGRREAPRRAMTAWAALFVAILASAAGGHVAWIARLYSALHLNVNRYPAKLAPLGVLAVAFFGAIVIDRAARLPRERRILSIVAIAGVAGLAMTLFSSRPFSSACLVLWVAASTIFLIAGFALRRGAAVLAIVVLIFLDSVFASRFLLIAAPPTRDVQPYALILDHSKKVVRLEQLDIRRDAAIRVLDRRAWLGGYLNLRNGQFDASTAAPVVSSSYQAIHDVALTKPRLDILDSLSVGYVLTTREIERSGLHKIAVVRGVSTFERTGALAMLTVWENVEASTDEASALRALLEPARDATHGILVSGGDVPPIDGAALGPVGVARITSFGLREIRAEVDSPRGGVAMLNQRDAPGWGVTVDGAREPALRANALFRGVAVPPGKHELVWAYHPRSLDVGLAMSVFGIVACGTELSRLRRARRRE